MFERTLLDFRRPGVSIAMNSLPSSSKRTSTLSRVVPGTSLTIIRSAFASVLTNVLLPTLRRPTIATFITGSSTDCSSGDRRQALHNHLDQLIAIAVGLRAARPPACPAPADRTRRPVDRATRNPSCWPRRSRVCRHSATVWRLPDPAAVSPSRVSTTNRITSADSMPAVI